MDFKLRINKSTLLEYIAVILILLSSNAVFYYQTITPAISIIILFLFAIYFSVKHKIKNNNIKISVIYLLCLIILILFSYTFHSKLSDNQIIGIPLQAISTLLIIGNFNFNRFKNIILNVVFIISLLTLLLYLSIVFGVLSPYVKNGFTMLGPLVYGWEGYSFGRFSSIYHEPGAYQIILNTVLILHINEIAHFINLSNKTKIKIIILIVALLLTKSTGGYLTLIIILFSIFYKQIFSKYFIPAITFIIVSSFFIWNSDVVQKKINPSEGTVSVSLEQRTLDNLGMLKMISEEPLTGYGLGSADYLKRSLELGNTTNSNGILFMCASIGIFWIFIFISFMYYSIKKMNINALIPLIMLSYILLQCNERFVEFPISYIFIYPFASYTIFNVKNKQHI